MDADPVGFILENEQNFRIAGAVAEAWPDVYKRITDRFNERLRKRLLAGLPDWTFDAWGAVVQDRWAGVSICKAQWKNYYLCLQWGESGVRTVYGVSRGEEIVKERDHCERLLAAVREMHPSAKANPWWEACVKMRNPASDWKSPEVLWRMWSDDGFLNDVAVQLLELVPVVTPILDDISRRTV